MPKTTTKEHKENSNHPCHFLSLPQAKRFWCRHCMSVFEDAITRWRHSRSCRYGVVNNFMKRRQLEAKALQNTTKPDPIEARLEQSISPSEEPITAGVEQGESSVGEKSNQSTSNDLFQCFICHSKFSSLEEMRHHVKYPCNNKKIVEDVPHPAMTVYIDEFTDRSRQWEPQPQEEIIHSELVPNIMSQETVHSTVETSTIAVQESGVALSQDQQSKLTPTNIYVNDQGETVIEVENLDLNSEGGELSLAHLLTQLSQQGIVFDKNKASQMEARQEPTLSDPASGEVYTTGTSYDPSRHDPEAVIKEEEEQPTAEDAANTLAQLSVFRGYRSNLESHAANPSISGNTKEEYGEGRIGLGVSYIENYTIPSREDSQQLIIDNTGKTSSTTDGYSYSYVSSGQSNTDENSHQITIQSLHDSATHYKNVEVKHESEDNTLPSVHFQQGIQPQMVTYISSPPTTSKQTQSTDTGEETLLIETVVVENPSEIGHPHHHHLNMSESEKFTQGNSHQVQVSIPSDMEADPNSYIVVNTIDDSAQIICSQPVEQHGFNTGPSSVQVQESILSTGDQHFIQTSDKERKEAACDTDEFEVQTVTLQEIAESESAGSVTYVQEHSNLVISEPHSTTPIVSEASKEDELVQQHNKEADPAYIHLEALLQAAHSRAEGEQEGLVTENKSVVPSDGQPVPVYVVSRNGSLHMVTQDHNVEHATPMEQTISLDHVSS